MNIKEIVNTDIANLANCESEPIHIPGSIQQHGFLLAFSGPDFTISFCSANCHEYLGIDENKLLGQPLAAIVPEEQLQQFSSYMAAYNSESSLPFVFTFSGIKYNTNVHYSNNDILLAEMEPFPDGSMALPSLYLQTKKFVAFMENATKLQLLCQKIAEETREITGYDRVMIYRFDRDYNGEVYAESRRDDLNPFIGLHYPHTDIPVQARELYIRNLMRMIADVNYTPVPLLAASPDASHASVDLSLSVFRSVSPIHIQYLKNMGVGATLTISLINNKKLWGLITCHHYSPKNLPHYKRLAAQLQGHFLTSQINVREVAEEFEVNRNVDIQLKTVQALLYSGDDFLEKIAASGALTALTNAGGAVIVLNGVPYKSGTLPADDETGKLIQWIKSTVKKESFNTDNLASQYAGGENICDTASGVIYFDIGRGNCIMWMRPEIEKTINWAGDPDKAILKDNSLTGLSPRKSFALWQQKVKYKSREWCKGEISGAMQFANSLQKQLSLLRSLSEEERARKLNMKLNAANKELENLNWISTHDLKEPLRKIQIFASRLLENDEEALPGAVGETIARMSGAAKKMQQLIEDVMSYSQLSNMQKAFEPVKIADLIQHVENELSEEIQDKNAILSAQELPVINGIPFQLKQMFINLINNALKFSKADVAPVIKIASEKVQGNATGLDDAIPHKSYYKISLTDNGIGFSNDHAEKIFSVFQRLHTAKQYAGTGIGLAICRKIMETHDGFIKADSTPGEGATFNMYFPVPG